MMAIMAEKVLEKVPPYEISAEKACISSMLLDKNVIATLVESLTAEDFYSESHQMLFDIVINLYEQNKPIDLVTLTNAVTEKQIIDNVGGTEYIAHLFDLMPTSINVEYYIKIVKDKSELRKLIHICQSILNEAYSIGGESKDIVDKAEQMIFEIASERVGSNLTLLKGILTQTLNNIEKSYHNKGGITGVATGFTDLDRMTSGFQASDFIVIAGRPSMGKTAFVLNVAEHIALKLKKTVAIFSLEMSKMQLCQRLLCSAASIDSHSVRTGYIKEEAFQKILSSSANMHNAKLYIDDTPAMTTLEIRAKARRLKASPDGLDIVFIDYLQLMALSSMQKKTENRQNEISEISRSMKALARELEVPVVVCSQLSRKVEERADKRPILSDLRESGAIEQDADVVCFLYRDYYYTQSEDSYGKAEVIISKQRNGPVGSVELQFNEKFTKFHNLTNQKYQEG